MNTVRLNITLPQDVGTALSNIKNKSAFIADTLRERFEREQNNKLMSALKEGYSTTKDDDSKLSREWDCTSGEGID